MSILKNFNHIKKPYVIVLIGPPLSGKSFFCERFQNEVDNTVSIISRDEIVMKVFGSDDYNLAFNNVDQKEVNKELNLLLKESGESSNNFIIDMTNTSSKRRRLALALFKNHYKIAVNFPILDMSLYLERNQYRNENLNKNIPISVIESMINGMEYPQKSEGFNKIIDLDISDVTK